MDFPDPVPAEGQVLLQVVAAPINPSDVLAARGATGTAAMRGSRMLAGLLLAALVVPCM